jgi:diphosphomevalonate decarboxylase
LGSGSACRSIPDGWVEWSKGNDQNSIAKTIFPKHHWGLAVLVVILSRQPKEVSSSQGHLAASKSPFFPKRLLQINKDLQAIKKSIKQKNFTVFGELMEAECLSMHAIMLTGKPSLIYWLPETVTVMQAVRNWRQKGLESYFTVNTGQNVFVFCQPKDEDELVDKLSHLRGVIEVRRDRIGPGARLL